LPQGKVSDAAHRSRVTVGTEGATRTREVPPGALASEVASLMGEAAEESEEAVALQNLNRELSYRKHDSIRGEIRRLVLETLGSDPDAREMAKQAVRLYDARSKLVQEGSLPPTELAACTNEATTLLERVLKARFTQVGGWSGNA